MDAKLPGTDEAEEAAGAAAAQPKETPSSESRIADTLARLRAETDHPDSSAKSFVEKLESEGISAEKKPKPEPKPAAEVVEPEPFTDDGMDDLLESVKPTRGDKRTSAAAIQEQLEAKGMATSLAKAMAHHGSRKDAEEFLANYGVPVQSEPAGQPATKTEEAPRPGAPADLSLAEVQSQLEELGGEETATAVTGVLSQMLARLQAVEAAATHSVQTVQAREQSDLRAQVLQVTGELKGQYPELVRGEAIDPAVGRTAAALFDRGHTEGDMAASIRAACVAVYGSPVAEARQTQTESTYEPELSAPSEVQVVGKGPIDRREEQKILTEVFRKYRNQPEERVAALQKAKKMIDRRNRASAS